MWLVYLLLASVSRLHAQNFIEPVEGSLGVEYYEYDGERYGIFTQKVIWEEASELCSARKGTLIDFETPGLAEFIARALPESAVGFGSLWIGGQLVKGGGNSTKGEWKWVTSNHTIETTVDSGTQFPMNTTPYWVDKPIVDSEEELCLGTDRRLHHLPLIVPVACHKQRPFICKLQFAKTGKPIPVLPAVTIKGRRFHLFQAQATWVEALNQCRMAGMKLAKLTTANEFRHIYNRMLRARPVMENAWIGGVVHEKTKRWTWVSSNEPINVDENKGSRTKPFVWYRPKEIIYEGCLLADRHVCDHFVYVEAKCDRRRNYICEQQVFKREEPVLMKVPNASLWVSSYEETWFRAQNICRVCFEGAGELLEIKPFLDIVTVQLPNLYYAMAIAVPTELRHVWIGGYLFENKAFRWTNDSKIDPGESETLTAEKYAVLNKNGELGVLVYCEVNLVTEPYLLKHKCLNLDRENQKTYFMYGLQCDLKQPFICQAPEGTPLAPACIDEGEDVGDTSTEEARKT